MVPFENILFLDIETAPQYQSFDAMPDTWKELWTTKAEALSRHHDNATPEALYNRAGIYAEFGKIICISCGYIRVIDDAKHLIISSYCHADEKLLLQEFSNALNKWSKVSNRQLCAHNGKEFDFPYLCRRMTILGLKLPSILQVAGKKPWEIPFLDTMELWKFGDYKSYTSLHLLSNVLGIPSSKDDMDGSMVCDVYWGASTHEDRERSLHRIATYCQKDVVNAAQVYLRLQGEDLVEPENIELKELKIHGPYKLFIGG
jgi:3'-5' exonuclease